MTKNLDYNDNTITIALSDVIPLWNDYHLKIMISSNNQAKINGRLLRLFSNKQFKVIGNDIKVSGGYIVNVNHKFVLQS